MSEALVDQLAAGLERLSAVARQADWRAADAAGLTPTQADILRLAAARGGVRLTAAAAHLGVSQPTASDAAAALESKRLIEKRPDRDDGRAIQMHPTRAGRRNVAQWESGFDRIVQAMSSADQATMLGIVIRALRQLEAQGAIPTQRMCLTCRFFEENAHPGTRKPHQCRLLRAPIGNEQLRVDCPEQQPADAA